MRAEFLTLFLSIFSAVRLFPAHEFFSDENSQGKPILRYGVISVETVPAHTTVTVLTHPSGFSNNTNAVKTGSTVVPAGTYTIQFSAQGYIPLTNAVLIEPGGRHTVQARLEMVPFALMLRVGHTPYDFHLNGKKYFTGYDSALISNIPGGIHEVFLYREDAYYLKTINSGGDVYKEIHVRGYRRLYTQASVSGILGLLPGAGYFYHWPESGTEYILTSAALFYIFTLGIIVDSIFDVRLLSEREEKVGKGIFIGAAAGSALSHSFFAYFGAKNDWLDTVRKRRTVNSPESTD